MKRHPLREVACLLGLMVVLPQAPVPSSQSETLPMLRQFERQNLGLMDLSTDGRLLLMHQYLRERTASGARLQRLSVIDGASGREVAAVKLEPAEPRTMLFLPSSHEVLVSGVLVEPAAGRGFLRWDPHSSRFRTLAGLDPAAFTFIQFLDADRLVGKRSGDAGGNTYLSYDLRSEMTVPFDIRSGEGYDYSMWERGLTLSPDRTVVVGRARGGLAFRQLQTDTAPRRLEIASDRINAYVFSPDGALFIVVSAVTASGGVDEIFYLSAYDGATLRRILHQQILIGESTGPRGLEHVAKQIGMSPNGQWLVVGFDRLTTQLVFFDYSEARYAVYELPSGRHVGTVGHPRFKMASEWASVSPAQSGRLKFSPDGQSFYTTSEFTRQWQLPAR
jgi:hypothetical protein